MANEFSQFNEAPSPQAQPIPSSPAAPRLPDLGELMSRAWPDYRWLLKQTWPFLLAIFVIGSALPSLIGLALGAGASAAFGGLFGLVAGILSGMVLPIVFLLYLKAKSEALSPNLSLVLAAAVRLIFPFAWVLLLTNLVQIGGFVLLIIPGIIAWAWCSLSMFALVFEGRRGFDALLRSTGLVLGYSWGVFWRWVGFGVLLFVVASVLNAPGFGLSGASFFSEVPLQDIFNGDGEFGASSPWFNEQEVTEAAGKAAEIGNMWSNLVGLLITPAGMAFGYALFSALRERKGDAFAANKRGMFKAFIVIGILGIILLIGALFAILAYVAGHPEIFSFV